MTRTRDDINKKKRYNRIRSPYTRGTGRCVYARPRVQLTSSRRVGDKRAEYTRGVYGVGKIKRVVTARFTVVPARATTG